MNRRNVLIGLLVLFAVLIVISYWPKPPSQQLSRDVVVATQDIEPFTIIEEGMVDVITDTIDIDTETIKEALESYDVYDDEGRVCKKMARQAIKANQPIPRSVVLDYCFDKQPEIISLPARFSEMVGGQLKPLHRINIWGYHGGSQVLEGMILIASNILVVDVRTARGEDAALPTPTPGGGGGLGLGSTGGEGTEPASIVTVAAEPEAVQQIISYLGAQGFQAWVTLTGEDVWLPPTATPTPTLSTPTPISTPTPTPGPLTPTATPTPGLMPDLDVLSITTDPSPMVKDQRGTVLVEVRNQGSDELATACWVGLYIDHAAEAKADKQMFCPPLSVGESAVISYTVTLAEVGYHALTAWADWLEAIPEEKEANNQHSASILVAEPTPTPTPTSTPTHTPTPTPPSTPLIHLIFTQWWLDITRVVDLEGRPADLELEPAGEGIFYSEYRGLGFEMTVKNNKDEKLWVQRQDEDPGADVFIDGRDGREKRWLEPGEECRIKVQLRAGFNEATVVLVDDLAKMEPRSDT